VPFDLSSSGIAEIFGWITPNSNQGFLALDQNNNGRIDSGSELFSNYMSISNNAMATNGFEALKSYDRAARGGNQDSRITNQDLVFSRLKVWFDRNSNGRTDTGELVSLSQSGVTAIDLNYIIRARTDNYGNKIIGESTVHTNTGGLLNIADLWFKRR
jgi:hypothetical protein